MRTYLGFTAFLTWLGLLIFLAAAAIGVAAQPAPWKEGFVLTDKIRLHYIEGGQGPLVVLVHGNAGSVHDFEFGTVQALETRYHVIAFDRPGHGQSQRTSQIGSVDDQARLLHDALQQLGMPHPIMVGHSWGGSMALA